jgi:hypothetical protein
VARRIVANSSSFGRCIVSLLLSRRVDCEGLWISSLSCRLHFWGSGIWYRYYAASSHLKVKDRVSTREFYRPITDEKRRDQGAGEREPGRDQHHCAEPGDEGLVYGALDVRLRPCLHTLRGLCRSEMGLCRLHLSANIAGQLHAVQPGVQAHGEHPVDEHAEKGHSQESRHTGNGVIHPEARPECSLSTEPSATVVSGVMASAIPTP